MKPRLYIITFFWSLFVFGIFQGCGVDPLETTEKFGTTTCERDDLPDTDSDGLNDECEKLIGSNPNNEDSNDNGINDSKDPPIDPNLPGDTNYDCSDATYANKDEQYYCELNGLRRKNVDEEQRSALLANSALNADAPDGTVVSVQEQIIRIVKDGVGLGGSNPGIVNLCKSETGVALSSYIYYKVVGTVKYCDLGSDANGKCEGTATETMLELCGPISHPSLANPTSGQDLVFENFEWTHGKTLNGIFIPACMIKDGNTTLTLTPSNLISQGPGIYDKMKVKFTNVFEIDGTIEQNFKTEEGTTIKNYTYIQTPETTEVMRNFKRSSLDQQGLSDENFANLYPQMFGPWQAGD
jgi:hypothetical protein